MKHTNSKYIPITSKSLFLHIANVTIFDNTLYYRIDAILRPVHGVRRGLFAFK